MPTKAELEEENEQLKARVAELESGADDRTGAVLANIANPTRL